MSSPFRRVSWRQFAAVGCLIAAAALGGCHGFSSDSVTGSIHDSAQAPPSDEAGLRGYAERWARAYDENPGEKIASINYARALRALDRNEEAVSVMRVAAIKAPHDYEVLGAFGKALADAGDFEQAKDVLSRAYPIERPDWTIMSVQGSVEDRLGNHVVAQHFYTEALKIAPGEPSVLANLGLSYALTKQLPAAEDALRQAADDPRASAKIRQNYALVLALEGKFGAAEQISRRDMSAEDARRNVATIRSMIAQNDTWRALESNGAKAKPLARSAPAEVAN